jgi:hypothetical protein
MDAFIMPWMHSSCHECGIHASKETDAHRMLYWTGAGCSDGMHALTLTAAINSSISSIVEVVLAMIRLL